MKRLKCFQRPWEHQFGRRDSSTPLRLRWCHLSPRNWTKSLTCAQSRFLAFSILANCVVPLAPATSRMSTIAFDLFFCCELSSGGNKIFHIFFPPYIGIKLRDGIASLPFVTCRAHMRRSTALTVAVSCVCQTYQLHRYRKHPRRHSMLLHPHARQHWLANRRSRCGSSLVQGRWAGEKEPSLRMARSYSKQLPRHNTPSFH